MSEPDGAWDAIVVGTGLGGATIGHRLAAAGHRVLFLEQGHRDPAVAAGAATDGGEDPAQRLAAGYWPDRMRAQIDGRASRPFPVAGCGAGGSSLLYAAALERFAPHDVADWPVGWDEWERHYAAAERLFRVAGTPDPLARDVPALLPVPPAAAADAALMRAFARCGLHPYRLHVGLAYRQGCAECGGRPCPSRCKSDARLICLEPALAHGATLLCDARVVRLDADDRRVTAVRYRRHGSEHRASARIVILAAGAYRSPALLLASTGPAWPEGLANRSGQVGRNLMFHANEWFAVWPPRRADTSGPRKTIGLRDLYTHRGVRLGSIQSTGLSAHAGNIATFFAGWFETGRWRRVPFRRALIWFGARIAQRVLGAATIFVMIVEDRPYADNRVLLDTDDPARIVVRYRIREELRRRTGMARRLIAKAMRGLRVMPLQHDVQLNLGHPCGTCRAGLDPATSVLDADCRAHGVDNLYVVDASFMPSSGGANPGLTVIANALRVAEVVERRLAPAALEPAASPTGA